MRYILFILLFTFSCMQSVEKSKEHKYIQKPSWEVDKDIINLLNSNYFKISHTNLEVELIPSYYVRQQDELLNKGLKVEYVPSGSSVYIYVIPTNSKHPYTMYSDGDIGLLDMYDMAIGSVGTIKEEEK